MWFLHHHSHNKLSLHQQQIFHYFLGLNFEILTCNNSQSAVPNYAYIVNVCTALQCSPTRYIKFNRHSIMQTLLRTRKIEDDRKDAILEVVSDKYCRTILDCVMENPKSAIEITAETKIPISTVYRRIQSLHDSRLLAVTGEISEDGKKYFMYKSKVKSISAQFHGNYVDVEIVPNSVQNG